MRDVTLLTVQNGLYKMTQDEKMQVAAIVLSGMRSARKKYMVSQFFDGIEYRPKWGVLERFFKSDRTGKWFFAPCQDHTPEIRNVRELICGGNW